MDYTQGPVVYYCDSDILFQLLHKTILDLVIINNHYYNADI